MKFLLIWHTSGKSITSLRYKGWYHLKDKMSELIGKTTISTYNDVFLMWENSELSRWNVKAIQYFERSSTINRTHKIQKAIPMFEQRQTNPLLLLPVDFD